MTAVMRGMNALSANHNLHLISRPGEPDEVWLPESISCLDVEPSIEIPMRFIEFGEEIACVNKKTHTFRVEKGSILDITGNRRAVILRRFEVKPGAGDRDRGLEEFKKEVELRVDLL